jgi:L-threonylcarbamoyladenylate synthase
MSDIGSKIPFILDGGDCQVGIESTVLDISSEIPKVLRPGVVTYDEIKSILGSVDSFLPERSIQLGAPKAPGMKYRHYAPKTPLMAVVGAPDKTSTYIIAHMDNNSVALMFDDYNPRSQNIVSFGHSKDYTAQASCLFDTLRRVDKMNASVIYIQVPAEEGIGLAVANRITKAAGKNIIVVI